MRKLFSIIVIRYFYFMDKYLAYLQHKSKINKALERAKKIRPVFSKDMAIDFFYGYAIITSRIAFLQLLNKEPIINIVADLNSLLKIFKDNKELISRYKKVIALYAKINDMFGIVLQQNNLYELALNYHKEALSLSTRINDEIRIIHINLHIASALRDKSWEIDQAAIEAHLYNALKVASEKNKIRLILCCHIEFLRLYEKCKQYYLMEYRIEIIDRFLKDKKISSRKFPNEVGDYEKIKNRNTQNFKKEN